MSRNKLSIESRLKQVDASLSKQEIMIDTLSTSDGGQNHYLPVSVAYDYSAPLEYDQSDNLPFSNDYIARSIDSIDGFDSVNAQKNSDLNGSNFGCLSCIANNSTKQFIQTEPDQQRNVAIVFGTISGVGAKRYLSKFDMLKSYMSHKVQESIKQSAFSTYLAQYTSIDTVSEKSNDLAFIETLCKQDNALLIAKYELVVTAWYTDGTYLHFYNCVNQKSVSYFEKKLAPTIHKVPKPYLTNDVLIEVDKSVNYMINKLRTNKNKADI